MNTRFRRRLVPATLASITGFFALSLAPVHAAFMPISQPNSAYTSSTTLIPITGMDGDTQLTLSDANLTVTFSALMQQFTAETSWSAWGSPPATEGNMTRVLAPVDFLTTPSVTMTFSQPLTTFGLEAEPDASTYGPFPMHMDFFNGVTLLGTVSYSAVDPTGAVLFAATSMTPITSATLTVEGNANLPEGTDPGMARFRYALAAGPQSVPEGGPAIWLIAATFLILFTVQRLRYAGSS
jgi:hypothetical protein